MKAKSKRKDTPPGCRECRWTGRVYVTLLKNNETAMGYCSCARGVWRKQLAEKRDAGLPV